MRTAYKVLAYLVALEVVVQAMAMVYAIAGLGIWVDGGGVFDKSVAESDDSAFGEAVGFMVHGINGSMVIPLLALALLVVSFFTRTPGASRWAGLVLLLVAVQATLGIFAHVVAGLGALHGLNALLLFTTALVTARRVTATARKREATPSPADVSTTA
jgi:heme A synthase